MCASSYGSTMIVCLLRVEIPLVIYNRASVHDLEMFVATAVCVFRTLIKDFYIAIETCSLVSVRRPLSGLPTGKTISSF